MTDSTGVQLFPEVSERLGKYRILRQLARGGMAEIFLATAAGIEGFEKLCVIKRALPLLASRPDTVEMFLAEARIAASLHHSNIAQVFDIGVDEGRHYFVMEFLRGEDLHHLLKRAQKVGRALDFDHIVTITISVCAALHYAHELRDQAATPLEIVHRDISPQNIFITNDGSVKLCDFGIAKSAARHTETEVGTIKGKIRYMSPEQCQEKPLDRRTDLFSLAIVLWEMVTLRPLYKRDSALETFMAICDDPPPTPSSMRPDVPPGLDAIILKGLSKRREDRYQTAQEMQGALEDWARAHRVPASPLRLASFMAELFGTPAATVPMFLEQITEDDGVATRIRALNQHRESTDAEAAPTSDLGPTRDLHASDARVAVSAPSERHTGRMLALASLLAVVAVLGVVAGHRTNPAPSPSVPVVAPVVAPEQTAPVPVSPPPTVPTVAPAPLAITRAPVATPSLHRHAKRPSIPKPAKAVDALFPR